MYKLVLFDFDGTLADTSEGIINSHKFAYQSMGKSVPSDSVLYSVIGGPLLETYITRFGFDDDSARESVAHYRDFYARQGICQARLYDGVKDFLESLRSNNILAGIATLKAERFAKIMAKNLGIYDFFTVIHGIDGDDKSSKAQIIERCMKDVGVSPSDTLMIGDSIHDYNGAAAAGTDFAGVSYGFGFHEATYDDIYVFGSLAEIGSVVLMKK